MPAGRPFLSRMKKSLICAKISPMGLIMSSPSAEYFFSRACILYASLICAFLILILSALCSLAYYGYEALLSREIKTLLKSRQVFFYEFSGFAAEHILYDNPGAFLREYLPYANVRPRHDYVRHLGGIKVLGHIAGRDQYFLIRVYIVMQDKSAVFNHKGFF